MYGNLEFEEPLPPQRLGSDCDMLVFHLEV